MDQLDFGPDFPWIVAACAVLFALYFARRRWATRAQPRPAATRIECPGFGRGGAGAPCCARAGEFNGYGSGPTLFTCPERCHCHE